jgi:hypothetical protein
MKRSSLTSLQSTTTEPGLVVFDLGAHKLTGHVIEEDDTGFILSWPAVMSINVRPVNPNETSFEYRVRFEPIAFVGELYKLYHTAIRGVSIRYEHELKQGYANFITLARAGSFDLRPPLIGSDTVAYTPSDTEAPEVTTGGSDVHPGC